MQQDMSIGVSRGCELRELPHPPQEGEMPVEQCCFQMKKSHSKGLGKHLSDEAAWPFPAGDGSQGLLDSSALIHQQWWEWGGCTPGAGSIPHPLVQGCHVQGQGLIAVRAEQGPGSLSHPIGTATSWRVTLTRAAQPLPLGPCSSRNKSQQSRGWGRRRELFKAQSLKSCRTVLWKEPQAVLAGAAVYCSC